jgi:hypothetical protein
MQTRLPRRVLRFYGFGVAASRKRDAHAADSARSASPPDYRQPINRSGRNTCVEGRPRLDDMAGDTVFLRIRTIQERSRLDGAALRNASRDLKPSDILRIECGVYGHTMSDIGVCLSPPNITRT